MSVNILITGSSGYIGNALKEYLAPYYNVIGYDIVEGNDINDQEKLIECFRYNNIELVIHLAALSTVSECNEDEELAELINGIGTHNVLRAMETSGCKNIIYASTSSVYGDNEKVPYTEEMPPTPCSSYGNSKLLGEHHIIADKYLEKYIIFRMFNVVGNFKHSTSAGYDRLFGALQTGKIVVYGKDYPTSDGTCERDYISLKDTCRAYLLGIESMFSHELRSRWKHIINICSNKLSSVDSIVDTWNNLSQQQITYSYGDRRLGDPPKVYGSNIIAKELINWVPEQTMKDIIIDMTN